jgi:hypothetical protein
LAEARAGAGSGAKFDDKGAKFEASAPKFDSDGSAIEGSSSSPASRRCSSLPMAVRRIPACTTALRISSRISSAV